MVAQQRTIHMQLFHCNTSSCYFLPKVPESGMRRSRPRTLDCPMTLGRFWDCRCPKDGFGDLKNHRIGFLLNHCLWMLISIFHSSHVEIHNRRRSHGALGFFWIPSDPEGSALSTRRGRDWSGLAGGGSNIHGKIHPKKWRIKMGSPIFENLHISRHSIVLDHTVSYCITLYHTGSYCIILLKSKQLLIY